MRMGKWLHQAMYSHYLAFFKTDGLLAMADWPHAQAKDFGHFWHERFEIDVPDWMIGRVSSVNNAQQLYSTWCTKHLYFCICTCNCRPDDM
jgi:hypothetical protein